MLRGTNQEFGRPYNRRIVLEAIRLYGPVARGDIAERVGLTVQTVSTIIRELADQHYLLPVRGKPKGKGQPPTLLTVNPDGGFAIGISVTPLGIAAALLDLCGNIVGEARRATSNPTRAAAFTAIGELSRDLMALRPAGRMLGVGMVLPGPFDVEGLSFVGPTTMAGWDQVRLREQLAAATGLPAFVDVDMVAAALGEHLYGAGAGFADFYYLHFSVGLGGTMVHEDTALRGAWGNAGEIGHIPLVPDGRLCPCGNRGCLERYLSLDAFAQRPAGQDEAGWVSEIAPLFRNAITTIENLFDPETIVLGGLAPQGLLHQLAALAGQLPSSVSARTDRTAPRVIVSGDDKAVLRGAAAMAVSSILSPRFGTLFAARRPPPQPTELAA